MARYRFIQNNFLNGEVSPEFIARTDLDQYRTGVETLENMIALSSGGAQRRKGTEFIADQVDGADIPSGSRLIPFIFNDNEAYVIIIRPDDSTFTSYNVRSGLFTDFNAASEDPQELRPSYFKGDQLTANQLRELQYAQSGDFLFVTHPEFRPFYIARNGIDSFVVQVSNVRLGSALADPTQLHWEDLNITSTTLTASAGSGNITVTASTSIFTDDYIGSSIYFVDGGVVGNCVVTAVTSGTLLSATVESSLPAAATGGLTTWAFEAWSSANGFPRAISFHEQRLVFGGNRKFPDTIWGSAVGDIFEKTNSGSQILGTTSVANDHPFVFALASTEASEIQWLESGDNLNIGTLGREYVASGTSGVLGPLDVSIRPQSTHGSAFVQPVRFENSLIFVQKSRQRVRDFTFFRDENSFRSLDITYFSDHAPFRSLDLDDSFCDAGFQRIVAQESGQGILWLIDDNNALIGITRRKTTNNLGFHFHKIGGSFGDLPPKVESIVVVPSKDGRGDDLYLLVSRIIDGNIKTYFEKIGRSFNKNSIDPDTGLADNLPIFVDSATYLQQYATSEVNFRAAFTSSFDADITSGGSPTPTQNGTPSISSGFAVYAAGESSTYGIVTTAGFRQRGCLRYKFKAIAGFAGTTANTSMIILNDLSDPNFIQIRRFGPSKTFQVIISSTAGTILDQKTPRFDLTIDQEYEIELNWDVGPGRDNTRFFIDGVQLGETMRKTGDMGTGGNITQFIVQGPTGGIEIDEVTLFETNIHQTTYTPQPFALQSTSITGLDYLEGEDVQVLADGIYISGKTVSSGGLTLPRVASKIIIGLQYTPKVKTLPVEPGSIVGSSVDAIQRVDRATIRLHKTIGMQIGSTEDNLHEIVFRPANHPMNTALPLFTGDKIIDLRQDPDIRAQVLIQQDQPFPLTILGIMLRGIVYD